MLHTIPYIEQCNRGVSCMLSRTSSRVSNIWGVALAYHIIHLVLVSIGQIYCVEWRSYF